MPDNLEKIRIEYWTSLGWIITQSLGLWNAEKSFPGFEEKFAIEGVETFEDLDKLINAAEQENAKKTDEEQGLAVVKSENNIGVFAGETTVNLDGESPAEANEADDVPENYIDAETEDAEVDSKPQPPRVFETLKVILTKEEKEKKTSELLQVMNTRDDTVNRFDSVKKSHQAEIKGYERDIYRLRNVVDTGTEHREVECRQNFDYERGIVDIFRVDTGAYVRSRQMKDAERQARLFE